MVFPKMEGTPPKWMVIILENPIKMDDLEGCFPLFSAAPICCTIFSGTTVLFRAEPRSFVRTCPQFVPAKNCRGEFVCPKAGHEFPGGGNSHIFYFFSESWGKLPF